IGTKRSLGANPPSASTSNATRSSSSKVSGTPSITLTTQSRHPGPRTAQSSQSITTGSAAPGGTVAARSGSLVCAIWLVLSIFVVGLSVTLTAGTDNFSRRFFTAYGPASPPQAGAPHLRGLRGPHRRRRARHATHNPAGVGATA